VKYRGAKHGTNEYPTLIDEHGLSVLPISSLGLTYPVSVARISTGNARLDAMLGGKGYYRGSSILIAGTAGTGKTSLATSFIDRVCRQGGKALYCAFEESPEQIVRNMRSIGMDLDKWRQAERLQFQAIWPPLYGLEMHLASLHKLVKDFKPLAVVMDPITNMLNIGESAEVKAMLTRMIDFLKNQGITSVFTSLTGDGHDLEQSEVGISSLMDTWLQVRVLEANGERNRLLYVLKSRGMAHSNQMREFLLSDEGIRLQDVYLGAGTVFTGAARLVQEAQDQASGLAEREAAEQRERDLAHEQATLEAQAATLLARVRRVKQERQMAKAQARGRGDVAGARRRALAHARQAD
jgi:circadian clock protein KaiC